LFMGNQTTVNSGPHSSGAANTTTAVLFDRDGVLTYFDVEAAVAFFRPLLPISLTEIARRWQTLGTAIGFPRNLGEERLFWVAFWDQLSAEFALAGEQRAALDDLDYTRFIVPYPEVPSVLARLRAWNVQLGVLSNFSLASLEQSLVTTGLAQYFHIACSAAVIGAAKPSVQAYKIALDALQVEPNRCIYFDDEEECVEGARRLGLRAYLVDRQAATYDYQSARVCNLTIVPELLLHSVI
jgi:putative hydrolase of the HAD superfamily